MKYVVGATVSDEISQRELDNKKIAYKAACEGIVLLKNENECLPLRKGKIALFGSGAILTVKGGTGSGEVNERHSTSILEGLQTAGFEITTMKYLRDIEEEYANGIEEQKERFKKLSLIELFNAMNLLSCVPIPYGRPITSIEMEESKTDTAIYVIARQAGEGNDKKIENGEFDLDKVEVDNIRKISKFYKKTIVVINSGSYMDISPLDEMNIDSIIFFCQQGSEGGNAFASLLLGKVSPSGKLTDTWFKSYKDIPCGDDYSYRSGDTSQEYYKEGILVGYRYADIYNVQPRYHFGFGLSYSTFEMNVISQSFEKDEYVIDVEVTNTGKYEGKEVVQVYVSCPNGKIKKEYQRLVAFKKTKSLKPGDKEIVRVAFDMDYCASYFEDTAESIIEKGNYVVRVGTSSRNNTITSYIEVKDNIIVSKLKNICPLTKAFDEIDIPEKELDYSKKVPVVEYTRVKKFNQVYYYEPGIYHDKKVDEIMTELDTKDMIDVVVGTGLEGMINTKYIVCPGAVGRTTDKLYKKGLINVNLSDGPAGIRILKRSAITNHLVLKLRMVDYLMSFMEYFPKWLKKIINPKKNDTVIYQFTTCFPVGTSLAQTWNQELCEQIGRAVSVEMEEYNITYWLSPAMNIHRNPLCGRNFEYYSEDPVLTGKIASSITRGVQSNEGHYVTIKHFACNNQEDNRNKCSSNVHERALREIYLRGFEIVTKEAQPKSCMTSYNLVNGVYTPNSHDLITDVLRNEWGFDGVVMTDWYATGLEQGTKIQLGRDDVAISVGNDLIMPGGNANKKVIYKGLKEGTVSYEELQRACANVVRQIVHSKMNEKYPPEYFEK